jgi:hypothetical protein
MFVFATLAYAQETTPTMHLTLDKAIELALSDNPTIKIAEQEIQLKEVAKKEAWQNLLPTVSIDGTISYSIKVAEIKTSMGSFKMGMDDSNTWNGALQVALPLYAPAVYKTMGLTKSDLELAVEKSRGSKIDMVKILATFKRYITYHTTYFNVAKQYINSLADIEKVNTFTYGTDVSEIIDDVVIKQILKNGGNLL